MPLRNGNSRMMKNICINLIFFERHLLIKYYITLCQRVELFTGVGGGSVLGRQVPRADGPMGIALSCGGGRFRFNAKKDKQWFRIDPVVLTKAEATEILAREGQRPGTYLLYEDVEKERICLSFRTTEGEVVHYSIVKLNDLFYFNDFPFPYLESIVLYYKKYKFKDTRLTQQVHNLLKQEEKREILRKNKSIRKIKCLSS
ncbi:unnamed protein product [Larinioides sclopetarius]|uniref:SH2 domain-containing protein n=1 Tax=Larinioides sclopetarius TaxID=280406 RepID=A0AAV1YW81_9ARAC